MPTPFERLEKIIAAITPPEVIHVVWKITEESVFFDSKNVKERQIQEIPEDRELQLALQPSIREFWVDEKGKFEVHSDPHTLFHTVKSGVLREYWKVSTRCEATKRKTSNFIEKIGVQDKLLPNYLIQVFIKIHSDSYPLIGQSEKEALFEQFESLRRTYGLKIT